MQEKFSPSSFRFLNFVVAATVIVLASACGSTAASSQDEEHKLSTESAAPASVAKEASPEPAPAQEAAPTQAQDADATKQDAPAPKKNTTPLAERLRKKAEANAKAAGKKSGKQGGKAAGGKKKKGNRKKAGGASKGAATPSLDEGLAERVQRAMESAAKRRAAGDTRVLNENTPARTNTPGKAGTRTRRLTSQEKQELGGRYQKLTKPLLPEMTPEQEEQAAALEAIGYLAGSTESTGIQDVVVNNADATFGKYNFYTSGHAPEAYLIDMNGTLLHTWRYDFETAFDEPNQPGASDEHWRRAYLFENGDVLAIFEGIGIVKVDKDSNLIWAKRNNAHHDLQVMPDGSIYVLTRKAHMIPRLNPQQPILEDFVTILDANGDTVLSVSLIEALEDTKYFSYWPANRKKRGDVFHTNTLEVLDGSIADKAPAFKKGNVLVSILRLSFVAVLDMETKKIVWAHRADFRAQHDPKILANGNMLIFDNKGGGTSSNVIELDPATKKEVWRYAGNPEHPFFSATCGSAERLPNGNTLIVESDGGRAFEIDSDKEIVWEFYNPNRAGEDNEYIATLFDVLRLPEAFPVGWASELAAEDRAETAEEPEPAPDAKADDAITDAAESPVAADTPAETPAA